MDLTHELLLTVLPYEAAAEDTAKVSNTALQPVPASVAAELEALGTPHPHVWLALVGALAAQGEKIGQQKHNLIAQYFQKVQQHISN